MQNGRPIKNRDGLTAAQLRLVDAKKKYDRDRYERQAKHNKWGSPGHIVKATKKALARRKPAGHAATIRLIGQYKWNAKVKGVPFSLSREQFCLLISLPCNYCGLPPSQRVEDPDLWCGIIYSGVDRVDNSRGYEDGNAVPCCKQCNIGKRDQSREDFLEWANRLYRHQTRQ